MRLPLSRRRPLWRRWGLFGALPLLLVLAVGLAGCDASSPTGPLAVATVNGHAISLDDYRQVLALLRVANPQSGPFDWQSTTGRANQASLESQTVGFLTNLELLREALAAQHASLSSADLTKARKALDDSFNSEKTSSDAATRALYASEKPYVTDRVRYLYSLQSALVTKLTAVLTLWTVQLHDFVATSKSQAESFLSQVQNGADFATLAKTLDPNQSTDYGPAWYGTLPDVFTVPLFGKNPAKDTPSKYSIVPYAGQYVVVEVTGKAQQKLSSVSDATQQSNILNNWLQNVYYAKRQHQEYIYIPPQPTQQATG